VQFDCTAVIFGAFCMVSCARQLRRRVRRLGLARDRRGRTDRATLIRHLLEDQYSSPVRIVAFNTAEGWSRDVSDEIAAELAQACADRGEMPPSIADFIAYHTRSTRVR
jgi:hypothetical protein